MKQNCPHCNSSRTKSKGIRSTGTVKRRRYRCNDCHKHFSVDIDFVRKSEDFKVKLISDSIEFDEAFPGYDGFVVTSCLNDTETNEPFFRSLVNYTRQKNLKLFIILNKYLNPSAMTMDTTPKWSPLVKEYALETTVRWKDRLKVIGDCNIQATASHPLTGIDRLSEGITTIVGHPVLQMKTLPVNRWKDPVILHSTGSISSKNQYSATKAGYQASFHHCFAALVVEFDVGKSGKEIFHIRQLLADATGGFHDLDQYWTPTTHKKTSVSAVVCGDEHVIEGDKSAYEATFYADDSIAKTLKPEFLIRHDVLDAYSVSKWHDNDFFTRFKKNFVHKQCLESELRETIKHLEDSTPKSTTSLIVGSNHHDHVDQWLNNGSVKHDYVNSILYHNLMWRKLTDIKVGNQRSAFRIFMEDIYKVAPNVRFIEDGFTLHGILLSCHGHKGPSGARGSVQNLAKIGEKIVIGHSHAPHILGGAWQTGTLSSLDLEYAMGSPSGWMHTNCIIHKNGKRQLVNIIDGKWKK